jgi:hypothetical protein
MFFRHPGAEFGYRGVSRWLLLEPLWNFPVAGRSEGTLMLPLRVAAVRISDDQRAREAVAFVVDSTLG